MELIRTRTEPKVRVFVRKRTQRSLTWVWSKESVFVFCLYSLLLAPYGILFSPLVSVMSPRGGSFLISVSPPDHCSSFCLFGARNLQILTRADWGLQSVGGRRWETWVAAISVSLHLCCTRKGMGVGDSRTWPFFLVYSGNKTEVHFGHGIYLVSFWVGVGEPWLPSKPSCPLGSVEPVWAGHKNFIWLSFCPRALGALLFWYSKA